MTIFLTYLGINETINGQKLEINPMRKSALLCKEYNRPAAVGGKVKMLLGIGN